MKIIFAVWCVGSVINMIWRCVSYLLFLYSKTVNSDPIGKMAKEDSALTYNVDDWGTFGKDILIMIWASLAWPYYLTTSVLYVIICYKLDKFTKKD